MRASFYLIGFAAASIVGAGATGIGCSSSSSGSPAPASDAAATDDSTPVGDDTGTGGDAAATCTPMGINSETFDSGAPSWACLQAACMPSLTACAANCFCNNAILTALQCAAPDASAAMGCFTTALGAIAATDMTDESAVGTCLIANTSKCTGGGDGGTEAAAPPADSGPTPDAGDGG